MTSLIMSDAADGLPKQFVASLKILFDILDEEHTGLIRLRDIESRWSDEGVRDLPSGVVEGLRKVSPPNGLLSFECFVSGLKFSMLQGRDQQKRRSVSVSSGLSLAQKENRSPPGVGLVPVSRRQQPSATSPSHPLQADPGNRQQGPVDIHKRDGAAATAIPTRSTAPPPQKMFENPVAAESRIQTTAAVKPQPQIGSAPVYRRNNNPQYPNYPPPPLDQGHQNIYQPSSRGAPPRPDRSPNPPQIRKSASGSDINPPQIPPRDLRQNQKIVNDLKNWQRDWTNNKGVVPRGGGGGAGGGGRDWAQPPHPSDDPNAIYENIESVKGKREEAQQQQQPQLGPGKATVRRHGSGRRHTLQNGVDHNMIKRMQQLDEESAILQRGLEMVDVARDWYLRQLAAVQDKQKMLGKVNHNDYSLEAHQERMNFQRARISEVNMQLRTLVDSSEKGFPLHMNLAVTSAKGSTNFQDASLKMVRDQNRRLTQEVSDKSEKISKLEHEKASLIRQLFESHSKHKSSYDDTTFM